MSNRGSGTVRRAREFARHLGFAMRKQRDSDRFKLTRRGEREAEARNLTAVQVIQWCDELEHDSAKRGPRP
jgi:hypothetical protein